MDKKQILDLEANAHLSASELREANAELARPVDERLEARARQTVIDSLSPRAEKLRKVAETIAMPVGGISDRISLRTSALLALRDAVASDAGLADDAELGEELAALEVTRPAATLGAKADRTLAETLRLDDPVALNPVFRRDLDAARIYRLGDARGLSDATAAVLIDKVGTLEGVTEDRLDALVADQSLAAADAEAAGLAGSFYNLLDERPELVAVAAKGLGRPEELVRHTRSDWERIVKESGTAPPGGISTELYAELLDRKVTELFPADALGQRMTLVDIDGPLRANAGLARLRERNPEHPVAGALDIAALDLDGLPEAELSALRDQHDLTVKFVARFPGLGLAATLDDPALSEADREKEIKRRTRMAQVFFADNTALLTTDLTTGSAALAEIGFPAGASETDKAMLLANARTYQRAMTVADDLPDAETLVAAGYHSALSIAASDVGTLAARTGLTADKMALVLDRAKTIASKLTAQMGNVIDALQGAKSKLPVGNASPSVQGYLKEIPGFEDFFGNQDFCSCSHCKSILGPAAYFVDLMGFIQERVTQPYFGARPNHVLNLKTRRPDLWSLELTCENTNKSIPYLEVINKVLLNAAAREAGFTGDFTDEAAVAAKVYKDTLPAAVDSFSQPLNLPFEEIRTFLRHFALTPADLGRAGRAGDDDLARMRLSLAPRDFQLITQANETLASLVRIYGVALTENGGAIAAFDAQLLLPRMGVSRGELGDLVATRFVTAGGTVPIVIKGRKRSAQSVQNDLESIEGLTRPALDRMHRFVRLWRATGWKIGELDLVLTHVARQGIAAGLDATAVRAVALLGDTAVKRQIAVEELVALWSDIPGEAILRKVPVAPGQEEAFPPAPSPLARYAIPLFDRLFNQDRYVRTDGRYPKDAVLFLHPGLASAPPATVDPALHRLQAATASQGDELLDLIRGLAGPLGIDLLTINEDDRKFALTARNLSLLYRHARLAKLLRLSVPDLLALCAMVPGLATGAVGGLADLDALLTHHAAIADTGRRVSELAGVLALAQPVVAAALPTDSPTADDLAAALVTQVRDGGLLVFADTLFALLPPIAPVAVSRAAVAAAAGGEQVDVVTTVNGRAQAAETITLAAAATLDAMVVDWNTQATRTRAYRSDAVGKEDVGGTFLAIVAREGTGSNSVLTIIADSAGLFAAAVPAVRRGAEITQAQARAIVAANGAVIEALGSDGRFRLKPDFDPAAMLTLPGDVDAALEPALRAMLSPYLPGTVLRGALPGLLRIDAEAVPPLVAMLGATWDDPAYIAELRGESAPAAAVAALLGRLRRLDRTLASASKLGADNLDFLRTQAASFGIAAFDQIDLAALERIETFKRLVSAWKTDPAKARAAREVLAAFVPAAAFQAADQADLAAMLGCGPGTAQALQTTLTLSATAIDAFGELRRAAAVVVTLGATGNVLKLAQSTAYDDLAAASAAIQAGLRSKYEVEADWESAAEPFRNTLLSRRRDGLVAYLVHSAAPQFDEVNDLYHYYLLDVLVEGCMRTSYVAAAIDSLQLYVNRCLMNLEETPPGATDPVHVLPGSIPKDEWNWRRAYRVWEANRKIFLYPENYIEPELRDDKTPLFRALEDDLLSKEITEEGILEAFGRYLRGFDELAHLTIAGSFHEKDKAAHEDVLHLLGVSADDPPVFYYRRVENAHYGAASEEKATFWGAWEPLNIQIPVRKVSPIVHKGQLYIFWIRYVTKPQNRVKDGESKFTGYQHKAYVEFAKRKVDGSWTTPQKLGLNNAPFAPDSFPISYQDGGVILDPIVAKSSQKIEILWFDFDIYSNFEPLYDNVQHEVPKEDYRPRGFQWDQLYPGTTGTLSLRGVNFQMWSPVDLYRLQIGEQYVQTGDPDEEGVPWLNPAIFILIWLFSGGKFDLTALLPPRIVWSRVASGSRELHTAPSVLPCFDTFTYATMLLDQERVAHYEKPLAAVNPDGTTGNGAWTSPQWDRIVTDYLRARQTVNRIATVPTGASLDVVNGSVGDVVIQTSRDAFYLQSEVRADGKYHLRRLNTSLSEPIADTLFNDGLDALLATTAQMALKEAPTEVSLDTAKVFDATKVGTIDYNGPMGSYLREVYFHIPFLIADHLNSQGRFEDAQRWYHYIFDPTSSEAIPVPAGASAAEKRLRELDRTWRYREFRALTPESLRAQLTNDIALEQYRREPFNPHAIARLRINAYQKAIVMKYVDNLIDWGDDLFIKAFARSNPELLRDATLKYVLAQEILGGRPEELGDCAEDKPQPRTWDKIKDLIADDSEFLMEFESVVVSWTPPIKTKPPKYVKVNDLRATAATRALYKRVGAPAGGPVVARPRNAAEARKMAAEAPVDVKKMAAKLTAADIAVIAAKGGHETNRVTRGDAYKDILKPDKRWARDWGRSLIRQINPIFCVPGNTHIRDYWTRVEDRLFKLRHCQDIDGTFRLLPLFAPEIDPALLVGGIAAGVSLEDLLGNGEGSLPPYRFRYLVDKAKGYAAAVQSFGSALLAAIEKRDGEELARLRNVHQKNLLSLTTEARTGELKIAEQSVELVERRRAGAAYRRDYFDGLIAEGLLPSEAVQQTARVTATGLRTGAAVLDVGASIAHLLPQLGSPFAMKYGGLELGSSLSSWSKVAGRAADISDGVATVSGIIAGNERRSDGWAYQRKLAEQDLKVIEKDEVIAGLRLAIAQRAIDLHDKSREQHDEVIAFFDDKFANLGLYTYFARALQQLHREAYTNALTLARLAEQAYRFERPDDATRYVGGEWDASRSGLLAGDRLMLALNTMDKRHVETNERQAEINQTFSLAQLAPEALVSLKQTASCDFAIPEFYFDMFYPGQYRRRIKAVRLTVPCITGPYTNISARLTLVKSYIRRDAVLGAAQLMEVPSSGAPSISTSTGQGDAGVFELNFRDERFMPFEGAGAVSEWRLELPSNFRPFDYHSINDVLVNISYTAEEDGVMRQRVQDANAATEGSLVAYLSNNPVTRVFSLRQEYSSAYNRLVEAPASTPVTIDIGDRHFPLFLQGRALQVVGARMVLDVVDRGAVGAFAITLNGASLTGFPAPTSPAVPSDILGGLPAKSVTSALSAGLKRQHTIQVDDPGALAAPAGSGPLLTSDKLRDVLLVVEYGL